MARSFSLLRRRASLVDIGIRVRSSVSAYKIKAATNFDGVFSLIETVQANVGKRSANAVESPTSDSHYRHYTRFTFNPSDYSLTDTGQIWLTVTPVDLAGADGAEEARHLVLPYSAQPDRAFVVAGTAPTTTPMELQLPHQVTSASFLNAAAVPLKVGFDAGGAELSIAASGSLNTTYPAFSQMFVYGSGGTAAFSMVASLRNA